MHDLCIHTTYVYHISYIIYHMHICTQDYTKHVLCSFLFRQKTPRYWCAGNFGLTPHRWWTSLADKPWLELSMIIKRSMINICYLVGFVFCKLSDLILVSYNLCFHNAHSGKSRMPTNFGTPDWDLSVASQQMATLQNAKNLIQQNHELMTKNEHIQSSNTWSVHSPETVTIYFHHQFP